MVAQSPKLRKGRSTRKGGVFREDLREGIAPYEIVIQIALIGCKIVVVPTLFAHIENALIGSVEEDAVIPPVCAGHKEGNGLIQRPKRIHLGIRIICIPHILGIMALIQKAGLIPQAVKAFVPLDGFQHLNFVPFLFFRQEVPFPGHELSLLFPEPF